MFFKNSINIYYFHIVDQSSSSFECLFFSFFLSFFTYQIHRYSTLPKSPLLIDFIITYQLDFPLHRALTPMTTSILFPKF